MLANALAAVRSQPAPKLRIDEEALERGCEPNGIPRRNEQAGLTVARPPPARRRPTRRRPATPAAIASRIESGSPSERARQDEDVGLREHVRHVAAVAGEHDRLLQTEPPDLRLESRPVGPVADDDGREPRLNAGEGAREGERILGSLQPADGHDGRLGAVDARVAIGTCASTPLRITIVLSGSQARLAIPAARSLSATQIVSVVSGRISPLRALVERRGDCRCGRRTPSRAR